ncbi:unnamed protein product, partial [Heterotrigona itama]
DNKIVWFCGWKWRNDGYAETVFVPLMASNRGKGKKSIATHLSDTVARRLYICMLCGKSLQNLTLNSFPMMEDCSLSGEC